MFYFEKSITRQVINVSLKPLTYILIFCVQDDINKYSTWTRWKFLYFYKISAYYTADAHYWEKELVSFILILHSCGGYSSGKNSEEVLVGTNHESIHFIEIKQWLIVRKRNILVLRSTSFSTVLIYMLVQNDSPIS